MKSNYKTLGNFIEAVNRRNVDAKVTDLRGLSLTKEFRSSTSNIVGTDMTTYKIMHSYDFAANFMGLGVLVDKAAIVLKMDETPNIVSGAYPVFKVQDVNKLHPEYLMMWLIRSEFDRFCVFKSDRGIRGGFDWNDLLETKLPIPHIDKQKEIVKEYNVIKNRIALNQQLILKLEETAQTVYKQWFVEGIDLKNLPEGWKIGTVADLCEYSTKRVSVNEISLDNYISTENMLQNRAGIVQANSLPINGSVTNFEVGNILISNIRPYFKKIWLANFTGGCSNDVLCFTPRENVPSLYLYQILEKDNFFEYVMAGSKGTKMPRGDKNWIMNYETIIPKNELLEKFSKTTHIFQKHIQLRKTENQMLMELKDLLLSKLATIEN
jgi:type I restriction enzyme, S subunit